MKTTKIQAIELENYRQFRKQKITFDNHEKNIYVIEGKNGFGKSNIYNSITWCFFNKEEHKSEKNTGLPICNVKVFNDLKKGQSTASSVRIYLETDSGKKVVTRTTRTYKNEDGSFNSVEPTLSVLELIGTDWKESPYPDNVIGRILPKDMRHFFFIDGEKLRQLFENIEPKHIRNSIFDLSQITLIQRSIEHLEKVKASYRKETKDEPDLGIYSEQLQELQEKINKSKKELEEHIEQRDRAYKNIEEISKKIEDSGFETARVVEAERREIKEQIGLLERQIESLKNDYLKYLYEVASTIFARKALERAIDLISILESDGQLPPKIKETFLEELLRNNKCICGSDLSCDEARRQALEKLLESAKYSKIANETITTRYSLKNCLSQAEGFNKRSEGFEGKIVELDDEYNKKIVKIKELDDKYGEIDLDHINQLHQFRLKFTAKVKELSSQIGLAKQQIQDSEREYKMIETMYNKELSRLEKYKYISNRIDICSRSIAELENIKEKLMSEVREETQRYTKEYFTKIISDKEFDDIAITKDYKLSVRSEGLEALFNLSAAETLCLGYSFMAALRKASAFPAPIIIDTPLAKIDREYRINVAKWFKNALPDAQIMLLVTNTEYTDEFKNEIKDSIAGEFILKHIAHDKTSEVINYGK